MTKEKTGEKQETRLAATNELMMEHLQAAGVWTNRYPIKAERMRRLLELENLPLDGVNFIPQYKDGKVVDLKLYINACGAAVKAEQKCISKGWDIAGCKSELIESNKQSGSVTVKTTLIVRDTPMMSKILDKADKLPQEQLKTLLDRCVFEFEATGAHSYHLEKSNYNKTMEIILKKAETGSVRRAQLRFAPPYIRADEEPLEEQLIEAEATVSEGEQVTLPETSHPAPAPKAPVPNKTEKVKTPEKTEDLQKQLDEILEKKGLSKARQVSWIMKACKVKNKKGLTSELLKEAIVKANQIETKSKEKEEDRTNLLKKAFAVAKEKLEMGSDDLREWVKDSFGKGLSEMDSGEIENVVKELEDFAGK